jgi:penicillin amidase
MHLSLLAALAAAWAPTIQAKPLDVNGDSVRILRDAYGVPHIFASTLEGLFHGAGYAIAQDRLWQMERNRRAALGELAEIYGKDALEQDTTARTSGYTEAERLAQFSRLSERHREAFEAYEAGVNQWMTEAEEAGALPKEFQQFGVKPRPWRVTDSVALAQMMSQRFGAFGEGELRNLMLFTYLKGKLKDRAVEAVNDIAWLDDPQSPATIPRGELAANAPRPAQAVAPEVTRAHLEMLPKLTIFDLLGVVEAVAFVPQIEFAERHGLYTRFGSYAVAVDAHHSATGSGLLLGAPQMGWSTPQIAHEIHLSGAGIEVVGMGFPGIPGVLIGYTPDIAWTTTSGLGDTADVFVEEIDPEDPGRYMRGGKSVLFETRIETIRVKGEDPVEITVRRSVHGPVVKTIRGHWAFARRASYWDRELENLDGFFGFYSAKSLEEFGAACGKIVTSHNFLAVTKDGEIGFWHTGLYPVRSPKLDPRFPVPGNGDYEWKGYVPFKDLPKCLRPRRGWLANWNNKPAEWFANSDTPVWGAIQHCKHIEDYVSPRALIDPDDLRELVREIATYQMDREYFLPLLLRAASGKELPTDEAQALRLLRSWDGHERDESAAAAIFRAFMYHLREETPLSTLGNFGADANFHQVAQASYLWHVLGDSPLKPSLDYLAGRSRDEVLLAALKRAVEELTKKHGDDLSAVPFRAGRMDLDPVPDVPYSNRGTYIMICEMARPYVRAESVLCPGQSEDPASPHYADQRDLASWWMYKPVLWRPEELEPTGSSR